MLRDLTKENWLELLKLPTDRIPSVLILRGGRSLRTNYKKHQTYFQDVTEIKTSNGLFDDLFVGDLNGNAVAYASVYGAPMASEIVHIFGVLGTPLVIQTGFCGAIAEEIEIGDLFLATEAYRGEGASQYYEPRFETVAATVNIHGIPRLDTVDGIPIHSGKIFTTSALLAEGDSEIEMWHNEGYSAVDMETSATFAVAEHFGMRRFAILCVGDNPRRRQSIMMVDEQKATRRTLGNALVVKIALRIASEHGGGTSIVPTGG